MPSAWPAACPSIGQRDFTRPTGSLVVSTPLESDRAHLPQTDFPARDSAVSALPVYQSYLQARKADGTIIGYVGYTGNGYGVYSVSPISLRTIDTPELHCYSSSSMN